MKILKNVFCFAKEHPYCYFATSDNGQPRVRPMTLLEVNETGFYFQTFDSKNIFKQLFSNNRIEICFHERRDDGGIVLRIAGEVEFIRNEKLLVELLKRDPILKYLGFTEKSPEFVLFRIKKGSAYFWTMDNLLEKVEMIEFDFKEEVELDRRF